MHTHNPRPVYFIAAAISLVTSLITGVASVAWQRPTCSSLNVGSVLSNVDSFKYHEFNTFFHKNAGDTRLHIDTMEPENKWVSSGTGTLYLSDGSTELFKHARAGERVSVGVREENRRSGNDESFVGESAVSFPRVAVTCHAYVRRAFGQRAPMAALAVRVWGLAATHCVCGRGVASACLTLLNPSTCPMIYRNSNRVTAWGVARQQITTSTQ